MKKIAILIIYFFIPKTIFSQSFQEGNLHLKVGLGISSPYYLHNTEGIIPPLSVIGDYALKDKIGVGGIVGLAATRFTYNDFYGKYTTRQSYRLIGGRATYHFWSQEHFDVYLGGMMGYIFTGWKVTYNSNSSGNSNINRPKFGGVVLGGFAGLNYSVNNDWGVFGEVGYNLSFVTGGAYWRLSKIK